MPCPAQVYELDAFKVTHATKYPGPIMSVGISPNAALLAVGLANGQLLVRRHSHNKGAVPGLPGVQCVPRPGQSLVGCTAALPLEPRKAASYGALIGRAGNVFSIHGAHSSGKTHAGAPAKQKVSYQRRLTAANYRYFMRGGDEKAAPGDVQVQLPGQKKLAAYDQMLRRFE